MCRWEVNIKMDLQWVGGMEWIDLAQDRDRRRAVVDAIMDLWVPNNARNISTSCQPVSFSRRTPLHGISE